jgi:hypothetical protein
MSELDIGIRELFAEVDELAPADDLWTRAVAWQARSAPHPRRAPLFAVVTAVVLVVFAGLVLRDLNLGAGSTISAAQAADRACRGSGPPQACLQALARVAAESTDRSRFVYQRRWREWDAIRVLPPGRHPSATRVFATTHVAGVVRPFVVALMFPESIWIDRATWHGVKRVSRPRLWFPTAADRAAWAASGSPSWRQMHGLAWVRHPTGCCQPVIGTRWFRNAHRISHNGLPDLRWQNPALSPQKRAADLRQLLYTVGMRPRLAGRIRDPFGRVGVVIRAWYAPRNQYHVDWVDVYDVSTTRLLAQGVVATGAPLTAHNINWLVLFPVPARAAHGLPIHHTGGTTS